MLWLIWCVEDFRKRVTTSIAQLCCEECLGAAVVLEQLCVFTSDALLLEDKQLQK